jgi:hypothetical protein
VTPASPESNPQQAKALFGRFDRRFTELQRQLERTAVGFGELKVEQAAKFAAWAAGHTGRAAHWLALNAAVPLCVHHSLEGEHVHALRSRERGCFLVVQTQWAEKIQSTTDAGSLNAFGRNEIEVAPISSALLRIACLVILYKNLPCSERTDRGPKFLRRGIGSRWAFEALSCRLLREANER